MNIRKKQYFALLNQVGQVCLEEVRWWRWSVLEVVVCTAVTELETNLCSLFTKRFDSGLQPSSQLFYKCRLVKKSIRKMGRVCVSVFLNLKVGMHKFSASV